MRVETGNGWTLRLAESLGPDGIESVGIVDHTICDPPYSERTHEGQTHGRAGEASETWCSEQGLGYDHLTPEDLARLVELATRATPGGWTIFQTSHDLIKAYELELARRDRYVFAPVVALIMGANVRLQGDGPSNWAIYNVVARPKMRAPDGADKWGTKPGGYTVTRGEPALVKGAKPLELMRRIVEDYTRPGELVLDPYAGSGTTGVACLELGRRFVGIERKPEHFEIAARRLRETETTIRSGGRSQAAAMTKAIGKIRI